MRRRNPSLSYGQAAMVAGAGALGGAVSVAIDFGVSYIPIGPAARAATTLGVGLLAGFGEAKLGAPHMGAGTAGGASALSIARGIAAYQAGKLAEPEKAASPAGAQKAFGEAGRVYRDEAGRVYRELGAGRWADEAGRVYAERRPQEAGAVVRQPRYVSAHNS